jgi:hypothetical protein
VADLGKVDFLSSEAQSPPTTESDGLHSYNHNLKRNAFLGVRDSEYDVVEMGLRFMSRA